MTSRLVLSEGRKGQHVALFRAVRTKTTNDLMQRAQAGLGVAGPWPPAALRLIFGASVPRWMPQCLSRGHAVADG
jgi:hypothetical protein